MYLSIVVTLFAAGTLIVVAGVILLIATQVPLWAAFLIAGFGTLIIGGFIAYRLLSSQIVLDTPTTVEMMKRGKA